MAGLSVIVLAAERKGVVNPLATRFEVSHKCIIPLEGQPLISHVLETLSKHPAVATIVISVEQQAFALVKTAIAQTIENANADGPEIRLAPAADNLADSVIAASMGQKGPFIITTADNALLRPLSLDAMHDALRENDAAIAMAPRDAVLAAHPEGQRRFYNFRDGEYSNCNLYGIASHEALGAADIFRGGGQFSKKAARIIEAFGLYNLILLKVRLLSLAKGLHRISRRIGLKIKPVILADGSQAIDVDNDRTYRVVSELLSLRDQPSDEILPNQG